MSFSKLSFFLCVLVLLCFSFFYYPKWQQPRAEATISWDVSGYYFYLPAIFIYHDLKQLAFKDKILSDYQPTYDFQQGFQTANGNYVLKYSCGQAIQYLPFFALAHGYATLSDHYPADGFSLPYQLMLSMGALLIAFLGLWFLRKILLDYFSDATVAITLLAIAIGTNYLEYTAITGALTHNNLFTIYCLLIYQTIRFYRSPTYLRALAIGLLVGLAALTRPTEILAFVIPVLWGLKMPLIPAIRQRLQFFRQHAAQLALAVLVCGLVGSLQLIYWKYVAGEWIVYSYQNAGFDWLHPHFKNGLISYQAGWLVYTPIMLFALLGFWPLYRKRPSLFWVILVFFMPFFYLVFAWSDWVYGGGVSQRAMIQAYPVLAFPLAAFVEMISAKKWLKYLLFSILGILIYYNIWLTSQAHKGGVLHAGYMTRAYFWRVLGKTNSNTEDLKLLDTDEAFYGSRKNVERLYFNDFEQQDSLINCGGLEPINGERSLCLDLTNQFSPEYFIDFQPGAAEWIRAKATFRCQLKEYDFWRMTQMVVRFYNHDQVVKERMIRVYRQLWDGATLEDFIDVKIPRQSPVNKISVTFWNALSEKPIAIDDLSVEAFSGE